MNYVAVIYFCVCAMGRRSKAQKELDLPDARHLAALRIFLTYRGRNDIMRMAKRGLLSEPELLMAMMCGSHKSSRRRILNDPDCQIVFKRQGMLIPCSSACGQYVWFLDEKKCDGCTQSRPVLRSTRLARL